MTLQSVLIATDFSDESGAALRRAAIIAKQIGLRGALTHVLPDSLPLDFHVRAAAQAQGALALLADQARLEGLEFSPRLLSGDIFGQLAQAAAEFDLAIAGARGGGLLLDFTLGRTSAHLVRGSNRPTLIVKRPPEGPYERVLAAVDFSEPSYQAAACAVALAPNAVFHFVHAFEVEFESTLRFIGVEETTVQAHRRGARERAASAMAQFLGRLPLPRAQTRQTLLRGYPPRVIIDREKEIGAQLVVVGKHAAGIVERSLIGSVALQVLEQAGCDVLVVPGA